MASRRSGRIRLSESDAFTRAGVVVAIGGAEGFAVLGEVPDNSLVSVGAAAVAQIESNHSGGLVGALGNDLVRFDVPTSPDSRRLRTTPGLPLNV